MPDYPIDIPDATISETTRVRMDELRKAMQADEFSDDTTRKILLTLYQDEKNKLKGMQQELGETSSQSIKYASDLTRMYREAKDSRREAEEANSQMRKYAVDLRKTIAELKSAKHEIEEAYYDTIRHLVTAAEFKDRDTGNHITRISQYSALMAEKIGMAPGDVQTLLYASPMHDIGKIGIPDGILLKKGKLLDTEFELMKMHTLIGSNILADSKARVLQWGQQIALYHHEKWNGGGYPQGSEKGEIPLQARIVALVDSFDALTSKRPYKEAFALEIACEIIRSEREKHFDPELVDVFFENINAIQEIRAQFSEPTNYKTKNPLSRHRNQEMESLTQLYR